VVARVREDTDAPTGTAVAGDAPGAGSPAAPAPGARVAAGALGLEGVVLDVQGRHAEVDVRGKRLRVPLSDLRVLAGSAAPPRVAVRVDLQPREGSLSELNVIGCTVDEAITRAERFLDESLSTDLRTLRIVHGYGTGRLRRGLTDFLRQHPLVARVSLADAGQGGGGATIVELKD
jgi:DNA mismatch repair protein MutS2